MGKISKFPRSADLGDGDVKRSLAAPETGEKTSAWDCVQKARKKDRRWEKIIFGSCFLILFEFHGDRLYGDDAAIIGGIASFDGTPVTVIAEAKGADTKENIRRNFGMPSPEGYRKALRLMKQAEKFHRPVICLVDTPGAFCGMEAEERGQGEAIARNLYEMSALKTPVLSIVISEGGSGGALALAVADEVWMMQNAIYSILSPEGFASHPVERRQTRAGGRRGDEADGGGFEGTGNCRRDCGRAGGVYGGHNASGV